MLFDGSVTIFFFFRVFFKVEQIGLSFLMMHFVEIDIFASARFLFAIFVWLFLALIFQSYHLLIFLSHSCRVLVLFFFFFSSFSLVFHHFNFFFIGIYWNSMANIFFKLIKSCHQASFHLANSVGTVFFLFL